MTSNGVVQSQAATYRPRLLPANRRLRHIQGICIRNLNLNLYHGRSRGKTIDDDALPSSRRTTIHLLDSRSIVHSRSFDNLRDQTALSEAGNSSNSHGHDNRRRLPTKMLRRWSTMDWNGSSLQQRKMRLVQSIADRMGDVFFSLHVDGIGEPVYVSEEIQDTMNPNFQLFDLGPCGPFVTRESQLTVKVWARLNASENWVQVMDHPIELSSLCFLGSDLEHYRYQLPENCVVYQLMDGLYVNFVPSGHGPFILPGSPLPMETRQHTSSYDSLMKLSTLDDCIQEAINMQHTLAADIGVFLKNDTSSLTETLGVASDSLSILKSAIANERRQLKQSRTTRDSLRASLELRRNAINLGHTTHSSTEKQLERRRIDLHDDLNADKRNVQDMNGQRRRICEDLLQIYPIDAIPNKPLAFTIRGLALPNSVFDHVKSEESIGAALGDVAHMVYLLSFYLSMPLPYPIQPFSSTSTISDPISHLAGSHKFPLYMAGSLLYRFEYGVFLLNKNIEMLSARLGFTVMDIRQTLPNLKYLLYVATAGVGQLPARKVGLRSFLTNSRQGSVTSSRRASNESEESKLATLAGRKVLENIGPGN